MWSRIILLAFVAGCGFCADHDVFKNCSSVPLCRNLRHPQLDDAAIYTAQLNTLDIREGVAYIDVSNTAGNVLILQIAALTNDRFRVLIHEPESKRYRLQDVLVEEPKVLSLDYSATNPSSILLAESIDANNQVEVTSSPFTISFSKDGVVEAIIEGQNLIMENTETNQAFSFDVTIPEVWRFYGVHEHADHLALRNTTQGWSDPYRLRNLDVSYYELDSVMALYGSIPVFYGHGWNFTSGVFIHNAAEQWLDFVETPGVSGHVHIIVGGGILDLFILLGPRPKDLVRQYANLTGTAHLPPLWALGYHQSHYSYWTQEELTDVVTNFDNFDIPMDGIWGDIGYTDDSKYLTWNPVNFSDVPGLFQNLSATNRFLTIISDPHLKIDLNYSIYAGALERDLFVKNPNGSNFVGECWPGDTNYLDFLNPETQEYYASRHWYENFYGSTPTLGGIWNDMNEPSVFDDSLEKTMPYDLVHYGGVLHRDIHNIYGFLQTKSTHRGLMERDNGTVRPFILTRAHFAGTQRYSAIWTGDNTANWGHLLASYSMCLNANLLGISFCGSDVGGFWYDPTDELFVRWNQAGAWLPFFRGHSSMESRRREPYLFPQYVLEAVRDAIKLRYKHMPVFYTLFYEQAVFGDPIVRPLFYHYPNDINVVDIQIQLLAGPNILVRAIEEPGIHTAYVYFPGASDYWYPIEGPQSLRQGGGWAKVPLSAISIPIYYRAGSIIPRQEFETGIRTTTDLRDLPYTLYVNLDENSEAEGVLYFDDYTSFEYQNNPRTLNYIRITYSDGNLTFEPINEGKVIDEVPVEALVLNEFPENFEKSKSFIRTIITETADGVPLKDVTWTSETKMTIPIKN